MPTLAEQIAMHAEVPLSEAIEMLESPPMLAVKRALMFVTPLATWGDLPHVVQLWVNGQPQRLNPPDMYPPEKCGSFEQPTLPDEYLPQPR